MTSASEQLEGHVVGDGWQVTGRMEKPQGGTGGNFSTGYFVEKDGVTAFMKAMDYSRAAKEPDIAQALHNITTEILFEREALDICTSGGLKNIIRLIDGGTFSLPEKDGDIMGKVEFFIFELANTDVRKELSFNGLGDAAWNLRILHQTAVALTQLHGRGIVHQDLKPSNVLSMKQTNGRTQANKFKVADLGRSSIRGRNGPNDGLPFAGDLTYITPEGMYRFKPDGWTNRREAIDGFLLGNLLAFLFVGLPMTTIILNNLDPVFRPDKWGGDFPTVLPYLINAHAYSVDDVAPAFPDELRVELKTILSVLTYPDPTKRGDSNARAYEDTFGLNRFVSRFSRLAKYAEIKICTDKAP